MSRTATAAAFVTAVALLAGCTNSATGGSPTGAVPPPSTSATAIPTSGTGSAAASPKPADVVVRFAIGSDAHWGMQGTDYRAYLRSFVDEVNSLDTAPGLDLAVVNGDLTNEGTKFLPQARTELERLSVPYVVTRGNNDYASDKQWRTIWGREINSTETIAGRLFVFASTSDGKGSQDCPDGKWIEKTLAAHADATDVYLVFHVPPVNRSTLELRCSRLQRLLASSPGSGRCSTVTSMISTPCCPWATCRTCSTVTSARRRACRTTASSGRTARRRGDPHLDHGWDPAHRRRHPAAQDLTGTTRGSLRRVPPSHPPDRAPRPDR